MKKRVQNKKRINKNTNIRTSLLHVFYIIMAIVFIYLFIQVIFHNHIGIVQIHPFLLIISMIGYFSFFYFLYRFLQKRVKRDKIFSAICFFILFIIQLLFAYFFAVRPSWDFGCVHFGAMDHVLKVQSIYQNQYFYQYGNNIPITMLFIFLYKLVHFFGFSQFLFFGIGFNILCIDIALFYMYRFICEYFSKEQSRIFLILTLSFTPFITYAPIFYTDTISLPFAVGGIYYLFHYFNTSHELRFLMISGLLLGVGCCLKFSLFVIVIAICIYLFFQQEIKSPKRVFKIVTVLFVMIFLPIVLLNVFITVRFDSKQQELYAFPLTHWIMMGLKGVGGYNDQDVNFTLSYKGKEKREEANIQEIQNRLKKMMKEKKLLSFYTQKAIYTWGDGTYFAPAKLEREPLYSYKIKDYFLYSNHGKNKFYHAVAQTQHIFMLLFIILGLIFSSYLDKRQRDLQILLNIIIFGAFLFLLLWEARSRYLVNFIPILLLSCYLGMVAGGRFFVQKVKEIKLKNRNIVHE